MIKIKRYKNRKYYKVGKGAKYLKLNEIPELFYDNEVQITDYLGKDITKLTLLNAVHSIEKERIQYLNIHGILFRLGE